MLAFSAPVAIEKRITHTGQGTWFEVGLGACGYENVNSDKIVALSVERYGDGGNCNQYVKITANGNTEYAQVRDECEACGEYSLDMSPSLFEEFASLSVGVIDISWNFEPFGFEP